MRMFGTQVEAVDSGQGTLKEAVNAALRAWAARCDRAHYVLSVPHSVRHPFPTIVRGFQTVIGNEARTQIIERHVPCPMR